MHVQGPPQRRDGSGWSRSGQVDLLPSGLRTCAARRPATLNSHLTTLTPFINLEPSASWHLLRPRLVLLLLLLLPRPLTQAHSGAWHPCIGHVPPAALRCHGPKLCRRNPSFHASSPRPIFAALPPSRSPPSSLPPRRTLPERAAMLNELSATLVGGLARTRSSHARLRWSFSAALPFATMLTYLSLQAGPPTKPIQMVRTRTKLPKSPFTHQLDNSTPSMALTLLVNRRGRLGEGNLRIMGHLHPHHAHDRSPVHQLLSAAEEGHGYPRDCRIHLCRCALLPWESSDARREKRQETSN